MRISSTKKGQGGKDKFELSSFPFQFLFVSVCGAGRQPLAYSIFSRFAFHDKIHNLSAQSV